MLVQKQQLQHGKIIYQMDYIILMMDINLFIQRLRNV